MEFFIILVHPLDLEEEFWEIQKWCSYEFYLSIMSLIKNQSMIRHKLDISPSKIHYRPILKRNNKTKQMAKNPAKDPW
jgi:hypothetical protein